MYETVKAFKLPWNTVSHLIGLEVSKILGRNIVCKANMDDHDYWAAQFVDERIPLSELYKLMETVNADEKDVYKRQLFANAKRSRISSCVGEIVLAILRI